jgi:hypothetical protein
MDELTQSSGTNHETIVRKVRKWLARKRFFAAGYAVVSIKRLGRTIKKIRAVRFWRRMTRIVVRVLRGWFGLLRRVRVLRLSSSPQVRARLYSEDVLRQRREEERKRREAEEAGMILARHLVICRAAS